MGFPNWCSQKFCQEIFRPWKESTYQVLQCAGGVLDSNVRIREIWRQSCRWKTQKTRFWRYWHPARNTKTDQEPKKFPPTTNVDLGLSNKKKSCENRLNIWGARTAAVLGVFGGTLQTSFSKNVFCFQGVEDYSLKFSSVFDSFWSKTSSFNESSDFKDH